MCYCCYGGGSDETNHGAKTGRINIVSTSFQSKESIGFAKKKIKGHFVFLSPNFELKSNDMVKFFVDSTLNSR